VWCLSPSYASPSTYWVHVTFASALQSVKPRGEGHSQNVGLDLAILGTLFWACPHFEPLTCISWSLLLHILWISHGLYTLNPNFQVYLHCYSKGLGEISSCYGPQHACTKGHITCQVACSILPNAPNLPKLCTTWTQKVFGNAKAKKIAQILPDFKVNFKNIQGFCLYFYFISSM